MEKTFGFRSKKGISPFGSSISPGRDGSHRISFQPGYRIRDKDLRKIHKAASVGNVAKVQQVLLLGKSGLNDKDKMNRTALHLACANGHSAVVALLLERKCLLNLCDSENKTALMKAVECQEEECATLLLEHRADPNVRDACGNTALHYAVFGQNLSLAAKLLSYNAHIEARNKDGLTPVLLAVRERRGEMVEFLVDKEASVRAVDKMKRTALMLAIKHESPEIARLLLQQGVDIFSQDVFGWTAEEYAAVSGFNIFRQLISEYKEKRPKTSPAKSDPADESSGEDSSRRFPNEPGVDLGPPSNNEVLDFKTKHVVKPKLTKLMKPSQQSSRNIEAKCGILRPESTTFSEDSNSDSNIEDVGETFPKPSPWFEGICQPAFPSPEPVPKLLKSVAGLGPTKLQESQDQHIEAVRCAEKPQDHIQRCPGSIYAHGPPTLSQSVGQAGSHQQLRFEGPGARPLQDWFQKPLHADNCSASDNKSMEPELENENSSPPNSHSTSEVYVNEELKKDMQRFKNEIDMLQVELLALEKEKIQLPKEVKEQTDYVNDLDDLTQSSETVSEDGDGLYSTISTLQVEPLNVGCKAELEAACSQCLHLDAKSRVLPQESLPMKGRQRKCEELEEKNTKLEREAVKLKSHVELNMTERTRKAWGNVSTAAVFMVTHSGNNSQVQRQQKGKCTVMCPHSETLHGKKQDQCTGSITAEVKEQINYVNDLDDLTQSSETVSEDGDGLYSTMSTLQVEPLHVGCKDFGSLLKIRDAFFSYERSVDFQRSHCELLRGKIYKMKSKVHGLQNELSETTEVKSQLEHQKVEWERELSSLRFALKQEEEKRRNANMSYEKIREQLRRIEDKHSKEIEMKQQLEFSLRALEMELKTVRNNWNQASAGHEKAKDLLYKNHILQEGIASLRLEIDAVKSQNLEKEENYFEDIEIVKAKSDDAQKASKLENKKASKQRLETEVKSCCSRLAAASHDPDRGQTSPRDLEPAFQRAQDQWLCLQDQMESDVANLKDNSKALSQQLSTVEGKFNKLKIKLQHTRDDLKRKDFLTLERVQRDLHQAECQKQETEHMYQNEHGKVNEYLGKQESLEERLSQLQSENMLLRQQLDEAQDKADSREKTVTGIQDQFQQIVRKLHAESEKQGLMLEERNTELIINERTHLKAEREVSIQKEK
uniref:Uncharacterized protein n=1 Tax=Rangifer tarandus platyrhynchus TaxID=3082113 RepID=A0ACB0FKY3_RANTA|nr:unnamed protein product [Rangifer tarandus platyrhynchus]